LANTPEFAYAQRQRKKVEALFAELKNQIGLRRVRLRIAFLIEDRCRLTNDFLPSLLALAHVLLPIKTNSATIWSPAARYKPLDETDRSQVALGIDQREELPTFK
jgi:hypothetical protein